MGNTIILALFYLFAVIIMLWANEMSYRKYKIKGEYTRKFAHTITCLAVIPLPYFFSSHWYILVLALFFFLALFLTQKTKKLPSVHDIERKSTGSYLLPAAIYITFAISMYFENKLLFILPMLILGVCDPVAAIVGTSLAKNNEGIKIGGHTFKKSKEGSLAFLLTSFTIAVIALYYQRELFDLKTFYIALLIAVLSTLVEFLSSKGFDNLTIPLTVLLVLVLFL